MQPILNFKTALSALPNHGAVVPLGRTHLYGTKEGLLALHCADELALWALDENMQALARICQPQPADATVQRSDKEGLFWIDLRSPLTRSIALGCEWLEPLHRDTESGLFLSRINWLMLSPETISVFKTQTEKPRAPAYI